MVAECADQVEAARPSNFEVEKHQVGVRRRDFSRVVAIFGLADDFHAQLVELFPQHSPSDGKTLLLRARLSPALRITASGLPHVPVLTFTKLPTPGADIGGP
jgi:hypothetical protein